jgi:hypothetical protein
VEVEVGADGHASAPLSGAAAATPPAGANYPYNILVIFDYKKNNVSTDMENMRGNKWATVTRGSRNPKHGKRKHYIVRKPSRLN